jgi:hypothetical protein
MRHLSVALALLALLCTASSALAVNEGTSLVLHGVETSFGVCEIADPCPNPAVEFNVGATVAAYLVVRNYDEVAGVQTAFDWGSWALTFGLWDCQTNQVNGITPSAPGPQDGTIASAFDCITGGESAVIGRLHLVASAPGCISQVESSFPFGNHVVSCGGDVQQIDPACWGSVCAGSAGVNACAPCQPVPVEAATWGTIKAQYK